LDQSGSLTPEQLLVALRAHGNTARSARLRLEPATDELEHSVARAEVTKLLARDLRPADAPLVRWLLEQETAALRAARHGASETLYTLIAALARFGNPADALSIWRAREATPESRAGVDVEQMVRAGVGAVRRWLQTAADRGAPDAREAADALAWLEEGAAAGAFDDLAAYLAWADERFGLHVSGPT
jgi:hypothetical protein